MPMKSDDNPFCGCSNDNVSRLEYAHLMNPFMDTDTLKKHIAKAVWNDERLLRGDIEDIANDLLNELRGG